MVEPVVNHSEGKSLLPGVSVVVLCLRCLTCADIQTGSCLPGYSTSPYFILYSSASSYLSTADRIPSLLQGSLITSSKNILTVHAVSLESPIRPTINKQKTEGKRGIAIENEIR